ncbi:serine/threonine-protein kinase pim-1-like [Halichoeres trimaculatus]|uniref:serine/threonine-protein kinase pim-1-like n=1 Tax=Halichoeres trimaculatus TaxID=147232 RepID=UPI003D9E437D
MEEPTPYIPRPCFLQGRSATIFEATYEQQQLLGEGGCGAVYAGFRRADNVPVAIKHMSGSPVKQTSVIQDGKKQRIPLEVALLQKFQATDSGPSAVVALLDWFDLGEELILVLERPVPCMDLFDYLSTWGSNIPERQAKVIAKQLLDALIEIESRGVFHRDIKLENILIETGSDVPRVRIIDFGCGTFMKEGFYTAAAGTLEDLPPEVFLNSRYQGSQTSVWQLGVVLYALVHGGLPFDEVQDVVHVNPGLSRSLSISCQNFLKGCLSKDPETRSTLESLKGHPWLR